ncbi:hypothetical protein [Microbacterium sp. USTB-Y]|uniref:hypothetical protein n=1 Tax=Microbacterium sp. USTB-Y TaxID=2823692 RepID=UPI00203F2313|nr:hypothetical protein [Microbacterium sp. USTB-Y]
MDLATLTDDDLSALRFAVAVEQERRQALATIPAQVAQLAARFVDGGGDRAVMLDAVGGE